jgi:DNA-binding transcriptional ArsR family regulator
MNIKNKHLYSKEILEICSHARIISNVDRIYIIQTLDEYKKCRVNQLVMETGLSIRQVYYQLSVLRKLDYITTKYNKGRYFVYPSLGLQRGKELLGPFLELEQEYVQIKHSYLRIVK